MALLPVVEQRMLTAIVNYLPDLGGELDGAEVGGECAAQRRGGAPGIHTVAAWDACGYRLGACGCSLWHVWLHAAWRQAAHEAEPAAHAAAAAAAVRCTASALPLPPILLSSSSPCGASCVAMRPCASPCVDSLKCPAGLGADQTGILLDVRPPATSPCAA